MTDAHTPAAFPSDTAWSTIIAARDRSAPDRDDSIDRLVRRYWKPAWWYLVRRWNCSREDAADLTQEFFAKLFEQDLLQEAGPERGRFRTFLKLKLHHLVIDDLRHRTAQKRGGRARLVPFEGDLGPEPAWKGLTPEEEFDRVWAGQLVSLAIEELERLFKSQGREKVFQAFWHCTLANPPASFRDCAARLGLRETDVGNYVARTRKEFRTILLRHVRESVERADEVEEELGYLLRLLEEPPCR